MPAFIAQPPARAHCRSAGPARRAGQARCHGDGLGRRGQRLCRQPAGDGSDIFVGQAAGDLGHAVGRVGTALAGLPGAELPVQVVARQAQQARYLGCHAGQGRAVGTGRRPAGRGRDRLRGPVAGRAAASRPAAWTAQALDREYSARRSTPRSRAGSRRSAGPPSASSGRSGGGRRGNSATGGTGSRPACRRCAGSSRPARPGLRGHGRRCRRPCAGPCCPAGWAGPPAQDGCAGRKGRRGEAGRAARRRMGEGSRGHDHAASGPAGPDQIDAQASVSATSGCRF